MDDFQQERRRKFENYNIQHLKSNPGKWRNSKNQYFHILPINDFQKNILDEFQSDFWKYFDNESIHKHQFFHHLNSSQALCFNLFFPLFFYDKDILDYFIKYLLNLPGASKTKICKFEKIIEKAEGTNFDFYIEKQNQSRILFEIKYTEKKFDSISKPTKGHEKKYETIYFPRLQKLLKPEFLNRKFIFENYQIFRNLSYMDGLTSVVFIFPEANPNLSNTRKLIEDALLPNMLNYVRIINLERLIAEILLDENLNPVNSYFQKFKEKYID